MDPLHGAARRRVMAALAGLPLTGAAFTDTAAAADTHTGGQQQPPRTLVAYFSRSGNTRVIAGLIHRQLGNRQAPKATLLDGFVLEADQERRTMETVTAWLKGVPVKGQGT